MEKVFFVCDMRVKTRYPFQVQLVEASLISTAEEMLEDSYILITFVVVRVALGKCLPPFCPRSAVALLECWNRVLVGVKIVAAPGKSLC